MFKKVFFLFLISFVVTACVVNQDEKKSRTRDKTTKRPRAQTEITPKGTDEIDTPEEVENQEEIKNQEEVKKEEVKKPEKSFVLPIEITEDQKVITFESKDNKEIQISVASGDMTVLAPISGTFSMTELSEEKMIIRLSSSDSYIIHILLNRSQTTLKTPKDTDKIKQSQAIAQTTQPFSFYALKNKKRLALCLDEITSDKVSIENKLNLENCN